MYRAGAVAVALLSPFLAAVPAAAEPAPFGAEVVTVGSPCAAGEINRTAVAATGTSVRCVAGLTTPGLAWEADSPGIQQIGRLQSQGLNVVVTRTGSGQRGCTVASATAPEGPDAAPNTINVALNCPA